MSRSNNSRAIHPTQFSHPSQPKSTGRTSIAIAIFLCAVAASTLLAVSRAQAETDANQLVLQHPGWIQVPGALVRPDCVHAIPKGAGVRIENGRDTGDVTMLGAVIAHYDPCSEDAVIRLPRLPADNAAISNSTGNGLVEASYWNDSSLGSSDDIDYVGNDITVPSKPSKNGAVIYLYNGVEDSTNKYLLEPTLQWGNNGLSGGNYWEIETYFITPSTTYFSPAEKVNAGDSLNPFSEIYKDSSGTLYWLVEVIDNTTSALTYQDDTSKNIHWTLAISGALSVATLTSCSDFPAADKAVFTGTKVDHDFPSYKALSPKWGGTIYSYGGPSCDFAVGPGNKTTLDF